MLFRSGDLIGGSFVDTENLKESSTGLYKDDFEYLKNQGIKAQDLGELGKRSAISGATTYGLGKAGEIVEGTKFDFSDAKFKDYFTDTARTTGIGGDKLAENITKQALLGNPELREEFLGEGLDLVDMPESSFLDTLKEISGETISEYKQRTGSVEGYFMNQGGYVQGYEDGGMAKTGYNQGGMYNRYQEGGKIKKYGYGGLIDMKQFGRRIL